MTRNTSEGHAARQVFDLPESQPLIVTEHRARVRRRESRGAKTRAPPERSASNALDARRAAEGVEGVDAPVQYGARIAAFAVYPLHYQFLPEGRLAQLMSDLFGAARPSPA